MAKTNQETNEVAINSAIRVENLDHLGIIAGLIDDIGIVEQLDQRIGIDPRAKVSTGVVVKAMLLNGLGFVSAPAKIPTETQEVIKSGICLYCRCYWRCTKIVEENDMA